MKININFILLYIFHNFFIFLFILTLIILKVLFFAFVLSARYKIIFFNIYKHIH